MSFSHRSLEVLGKGHWISLGHTEWGSDYWRGDTVIDICHLGYHAIHGPTFNVQKRLRGYDSWELEPCSTMTIKQIRDLLSQPPTLGVGVWNGGWSIRHLPHTMNLKLVSQKRGAVGNPFWGVRGRQVGWRTAKISNLQGKQRVGLVAFVDADSPRSRCRDELEPQEIYRGKQLWRIKSKWELVENH